MNGDYTSGAELADWLEFRTAADAFSYDSVAKEAQYLRAIHLQGAKSILSPFLKRRPMAWWWRIQHACRRIYLLSTGL